MKKYTFASFAKLLEHHRLPAAICGFDSRRGTLRNQAAGHCAATVGNIVRYKVAVPATRIHAAIALALTLWVVVIAVEWTMPGDEVTPEHGPHALASALVGEHPVVIEQHPHIDAALASLRPDALAEAVLPRAATSLVALGLIAALAAAALRRHQPALAAVRGPPRPLTTVLSGRVLLTRLCVARR